MASHSIKTKRKNSRKHRRGGKNIFWLVRSTRRINELILFSRKPLLEKVLEEWKGFYRDGVRWSSSYSEYFPNIKVADRISVDHTSPICVKLIICNDNPDMYIQRYKDCLFISSHLETYYIGGNKDRKVTRVPHGFRISNKLFPDVTEESGIIGVMIVKV